MNRTFGLGLGLGPGNQRCEIHIVLDESRWEDCGERSRGRDGVVGGGEAKDGERQGGEKGSRETHC